MPAAADTRHRNDVTLVGRLAGEPVPRTLPSGDEIVVFRLVVERDGPAPDRPRAPRIDTLDCAAVTAASRRACAAWVPGDLLEVHGSLRRRFWRAGAAVASRTEVEVRRARRTARA